MQALFQYQAKEVTWGYTNRSNLVGDFVRTTGAHYPKGDSVVSGREASPNKKGWIVYKCRTCDFITYAAKKKSGPNDRIPNFDVAVVTNISVNRAKSESQ
jgi:hypothetical protein